MRLALRLSLWPSQVNNMELLRTRTSYSYIGDFTEFLIQNEQRIKNLMLDYEIQSKVDTLPDGRDVKSFIFTKENVNVRFMPNRIDFNYTNKRPEEYEVSFTAAKDFYNLFSEIFYDVLGQRIAILSQGFIKNENNIAIQNLTSKMGMTSIFGPSNELSFKMNFPKTLFEPVNSVLNVDMGEAKNNKTQEAFRVLLVTFDVNTMAENKEARFNPNDFELDFAELLSEVKNQDEKLAELIK